MAIFKMFRDSAMELKSLRCLTVTAALIALDLVLKSVTVVVSDDIKITFAYLALASVGMLFGPTVGLLAGIITDVLGFFISSTGGAFNPLFTVVEAVGAMIYGMFLYRMKYVKIDFEDKNSESLIKRIFKLLIQSWRIIAAKLTVVVVCNIILNPLFMIILEYWTFETAISVKIPARLIKYAIQTPVDCVLMILVLFPVLVAYKSIFRGQEKKAAAKMQ